MAAEARKRGGLAQRRPKSARPGSFAETRAFLRTRLATNRSPKTEDASRPPRTVLTRRRASAQSCRAGIAQRSPSADLTLSPPLALPAAPPLLPLLAPPR